jgi:hypothetical protein
LVALSAGGELQETEKQLRLGERRFFIFNLQSSGLCPLWTAEKLSSSLILRSFTTTHTAQKLLIFLSTDIFNRFEAQNNQHYQVDRRLEFSAIESALFRVADIFFHPHWNIKEGQKASIQLENDPRATINYVQHF